MRRLFSILFILCTLCGSGQNQQVISLHSLLSEMIDFNSVAKWPKPEFTLKQAGSYDRHSISPELPGWFANDDNNKFIREEIKSGHTEYVMMDTEGPGAIVRFWLTMQDGQGRLRIYFDNEENASVQIEAYDLKKAGFNIGKALLSYHRPEMARGNTMYLPLPYQKHCKVTFERIDKQVNFPPHYYQINYRTYPKGTEVRTFSLSDLSTLKDLLNKINTELENPASYRTGKDLKFRKSFVSNQTGTVDLPKGSAAVHLLTLKLSAATTENLIKAWSLVILKMEFDGQQTVWCPVGDFAGSGFGGQPIKSWYREMDENGKVTSRWVMPYQSNAKITIINRADFTVNVDLAVKTSDWKWDSQSMYFHANYKYEPNVRDVAASNVRNVEPKDTLDPIEWNFNTIQGKGIYLGNTLSLYNNMDSWYGEGDAKVWVDDDQFPSEFGTGLEDYYNTSWAPVVIYQTPFANATRADNENSHGYNTFTRTRNLDGVPFKKSFKYDLEMLSWKGGTIDCCATTYWYGLTGAISSTVSQTMEPALPFTTLNKK